MRYFIDRPSACCSYAKCSGWQETLAHFFVKTRRPSLAQIFSSRSSSQDHLSDSMKNRPLFDITVNSEESLVGNLTSTADEMILTPPQSIGDSREDLLVFFKAENSTENLSEQSTSSLSRTTTNPSMNRVSLTEVDSAQIIEEIRQILGLIT